MFTLELTLEGNAGIDFPTLDIMLNGSVVSSSLVYHSTGNAYTTLFTFNISGGTPPSSLTLAFADNLSESGRSIDITGVKLNGSTADLSDFTSSDGADITASMLVLEQNESANLTFTPTVNAGSGPGFYNGGTGDDVALADTLTHTFDGGAGNDTIDFSGITNGVFARLRSTEGDENGDSTDDLEIRNFENITGSNFDDVLFGDNNANVLNGNDGADVLRGYGGNDVIFGGDGEDLIYGYSGDDTINGGIGNDEIYGDLGQTGAATGVDTINGGDGNDMIYGNDGDDILNGGNDNDLLDGGNGIDTINGDAGVDIIYGQAGNDILNGGAGRDTIYGGNNDDTIDGGDDNDIIYGGNNNDTIRGGAGADILNGDGGNDSFYVSGMDALGDQFIGGGGTDRVYLEADSNFNTGNVFSSVNSIETAGFNILLAANNSINLTGMSVNGGGEIRGDNGQENITGSNSADTIRGYAGLDTIDGGGGNDNIYGGAGADILNGGNGNDNFYIGGTEGYGDQIDGGTGTDEIFLTADAYINASTSWTSIERIVTGGFTLFIDAGNTIDFTGMTVTGASVIEGTHGAETITGTNSNDTIRSGAGNDIINGGTGTNTMYGDAGNDTITGGTGTDRIYGGTGADTLNGGDGNDDFFLSGLEGIGDQINGGNGTDDLILNADATINAATTFTSVERLFTNGNTLYLEGGVTIDLSTFTTISGGVNVQGQNGVDNITGYAGTDRLYGGAGNDIIDGGDGTNYLYGEAGNDTLTGGTGTDFLYGGVGNDTLTGNDGNDDFYGGLGADVMLGGVGADDFFVSGVEGRGDTFDGGIDADRDEVILQADAIFDAATTFINIERIVTNGNIIYADLNGSIDLSGMEITGGNDIRGQGGSETITGSDSGDRIYGGFGNDTLNGGLGTDRLYGQSGNDTLNGDDGNDLIYGGTGTDILNGGIGNDDFYVRGLEAIGDTFNGGTGTDEIRLYGNVTFDNAMTFNSVERIVMGGFTIFAENNGGFDLTGLTTSGTSDLQGQGGAETITGSNSRDTIRGNGGNDTLYGGANRDTLYGGAGDDTLYGDAGRDDLYGEGGADNFVLNGFGGNRDNVRDFSIAEGDTIDLSDVLSGFYDPLSDTITDFVRITGGTNSDVRVDVTGSGSFGNATRVGLIIGVSGLTDEAALETAGTLITS